MAARRTVSVDGHHSELHSCPQDKCLNAKLTEDIDNPLHFVWMSRGTDPMNPRLVEQFATPRGAFFLSGRSGVRDWRVIHQRCSTEPGIELEVIQDELQDSFNPMIL